MSKSNTIVFKNNLSLKRDGESNLHTNHGKVQKLALKKDGSGYTHLKEETVKILSDVVVKNPVYELVSEEEGTVDANSILYNILTQSQNEEIVCTQPEQSFGAAMGITAHLEGAPSTAAMAAECSQLQRSLRIGGKNMRALAKMVGQSTQPAKLPDATCGIPIGTASDLHEAMQLVLGMVENLNSLKQRYQDEVEVETAILSEIEVQAEKQRAKVAALIEGVSYLNNISNAVTAFDSV